MKKILLKATVLLTVGFGVAFADSDQEMGRGVKTLDQKSAEIKKQGALDRLNSDLSSISQDVKDCVFNAATVEQLEACHKQSK